MVKLTVECGVLKYYPLHAIFTVYPFEDLRKQAVYATSEVTEIADSDLIAVEAIILATDRRHPWNWPLEDHHV